MGVESEVASRAEAGWQVGNLLSPGKFGLSLTSYFLRIRRRIYLCLVPMCNGKVPPSTDIR